MRVANQENNPGISSLLADLKKCSRAKDLKTGIQLHSQAISSGHSSHIFVANSLINMYAKCGSIPQARKIFDRMPHRDVVSWNSLITGYAANGHPLKALELFESSQTACCPNSRTFVAAISACSSIAARIKDPGKKLAWLHTGRRIHSQAVKNRCCEVFLLSTLVDFYAKCGSMDEARAVFDSMQPGVGGSDRSDPVAWNSLLQGYVDNDQSELALEIFELNLSRFCPDPRTFVAALSACSRLAGKEREFGTIIESKWYYRGKSIHARAVEMKSCDIFVENTLVDMYSKCGRMAEAHRVFDLMPRRDAVSWTCLMQGYVDNGNGQVALELFHRLKATDDQTKLIDGRTLVVALSACSALASLDKEKYFREGKTLHSLATGIKCCDVFVENKLVDLYAECGKMPEARALFNGISRPDVVSWTALAMGHVKNDENEAALEVLAVMKTKGVAMNSLSYVAALMACGNLMAAEKGKCFHADARAQKLERDIMVANCLIDFYGKCGIMELAEEVFHSIPRKNIVSWTSLMCGYALVGDTDRVFLLFDKLKEHGVSPNEATFVCVLNACSHAGLTDKGREYFDAISGYGIAPSARHYACVIDLLGRANCLEEALKVLRSMPCEPDVVTWKSLLAGCQKWKNLEVGKVAYDALIKLDMNEDSAYVLMASIYSVSGMKRETELVLRTRREASSSHQTCWTDEAGVVHRFISGPSSLEE